MQFTERKPNYVSPSSARVARVMVYDLIAHNRGEVNLLNTAAKFEGVNGFEIIKKRVEDGYWGSGIYDKRLYNRISSLELDYGQIQKESVTLLLRFCREPSLKEQK